MNMGRNRIIAVVLGGAVVVMALTLAWPKVETPPPVPPSQVTVKADETPERSSGPEVASPAPVAPVAPLDAEDMRTLASRAKAGDGAAACQLAYQLLGCQHRLAAGRDISLELMAERERAHEAEGNLGAANRMAEEQARRITSAGFCRTIPADMLEQGSRFLRAAALAGEPGAMLAYGLGHHFNPSARGLAVDPTFEAWREEAPAMLHRALEAGEPAAVFTLSLAYSDDHGIPSSLVPDDPYRAAVYHLLWARMFRANEQRMWIDKITPDQLASARKEAERLHADVFKGQRYESKDTYLQPPSMRLPGYSRAPCDAPR